MIIPIRLSIIRSAFQTIIAIFLFWSYSTTAYSEQVLVNRAIGHGFLLSHQGNCFVVTPKHAVAQAPKFNLITQAPRSSGSAQLLPFRSAHDLAIGYVVPGLENRCDLDWSNLPGDLTRLLTRAERGTLRHISSSGLLENTPVKIDAFDLYTIDVSTAGTGRLFQGMSGSSLYVEGRFVGIAIEARNGRSGRILRLDEIRAQLSRLMEGQVTIKSPPKPQCDNKPSLASQSICNHEPINSQYSCSDIAKGQPVAFGPEDLPLEVEIRLAGENPHSVKSVSVSGISDPTFTNVKGVEIYVSSANKRANRWRPFAFKDGTPTGVLTARNGSAPYARLIKLRITSTWEHDKPYGFGCLKVE